MNENPKRSGPILGVDIGGTKVAVGLVDREGKILAQGRQPMVANGTAEAAFRAVTGAIDSLAAATGSVARFQSIGICAPGPLDPKNWGRSQSSKPAVLAQLSAGRKNSRDLRRSSQSG